MIEVNGLINGVLCRYATPLDILEDYVDNLRFSTELTEFVKVNGTPCQYGDLIRASYAWTQVNAKPSNSLLGLASRAFKDYPVTVRAVVLLESF